MRYIAVDTETHKIDNSNKAPVLVCVSTSEGLGREKLYNAVDGLNAVAALLCDPYTTIVGFNAAFDMAVLMRQANSMGVGLMFNKAVITAYRENRIVCGMLREKLRDLYSGDLRPGTKVELAETKVGVYSLAGCVKRLLGKDISASKGADAWRVNYWQLTGVPVSEWPIEAAEYAMLDATYHYCVYLAQKSKSPADAYADEHNQARAHFALHLQECRGITTNPVEVDKLKAFCVSILGPLREELVAGGLMRKKTVRKTGEIKYTQDSKAVQARVQAAHEAQRLEVPRTPTGKVQTGKRALLSCESVDPLLARLGKAQQAKHALNTEVPLLLSGATTPIHTRYNSILETGRVSSSPNVQNRARLSLPCVCGYQDKLGAEKCPKCGGWIGNSRRCFQPRDGYYYAAADYAQLELCTLAQAMHDLIGGSSIGEAINAGVDLHTLLASDMLGLTYADAMARKAQGDPDVKSARQRAKGANFGLPGGMGAKGLQGYLVNMFGIFLTIAECRHLIKIWRNRWPDMRQYFRKIKEHFGGSQYQYMVLPATGLRRGNCKYTAACNFLFQGPAAAGAKAAGFEIAARCYADETSALFKAYPVLMLHDEYLLEVPRQNAHEAATELAEVMRATMQTYTPKVKIKMPEAVLMDRWYKSAEPVHDSAGRLVPWAP